MKAVLGGKGANLAEMTNLGVPVPPGFTIACARLHRVPARRHVSRPRCAPKSTSDRRAPRGGDRQEASAIPKNPLLVSVRSGAPVSMPGMMETILNLGLNDRTVAGLARAERQRALRLRLVPPLHPDVRRRRARRADRSSSSICSRRKRMTAGVEDRRGARRRRAAQSRRGVQGARRARRPGDDFPMDPVTQLWGAIEAVWKSWTLKKAVDYRRVNGIPDDARHRRQRRRDGVRQPRRRLRHRRRVHAQSVDRRAEVLRRVPRQRAGRGRRRRHSHAARHRRDGEAAARRVRGAARDAGAARAALPRHAGHRVHRRARQALSAPDAHRKAHRGGRGAHRERDGRRRAHRRSTRPCCASRRSSSISCCIRSSIRSAAREADLPPACRRAPARRAASRCSIPTSPSSARAAGDAVILVRDETTPEDFHGIVAARAVLTARGGMTSHAAVVARGMGKCAVVGCKEIDVDLEQRTLQRRRHDGRTRATGSRSTARPAGLRRRPADDAERGRAGHARHAPAPTRAGVSVVLASCLAGPTTCARLQVRANADTPHDARIARAFGAEGIGLCRTEHMFFEGDRITAMREMIVARDEGGRRRALAKLLPMQRADFEGIFEAMDGLPGHDPAARSAAARVPAARRRGVASCSRARSAHARRARRRSWSRCARRTRCSAIAAAGWASPTPRSPRCRARAIFEAAVRAKRRGIDVRPEIMIPLVATVEEFEQPARDPRGRRARRCSAGWARSRLHRSAR